MRVKVKLVVFRYPEPAKWGTYCSYCPELQYFFGRGETEKAVIENVKTYLLQELYHRERYGKFENLRMGDNKGLDKSSYFYRGRSGKTNRGILRTQN